MNSYEVQIETLKEQIKSKNPKYTGEGDFEFIEKEGEFNLHVNLSGEKIIDVTC